MKQRLIFTVALFVAVVFTARAQVKYEDRNGCVVEMSIEQQPKGLFLWVKTDSESSKIDEDALLTFQLATDRVLALPITDVRYETGTDRFSLSGLPMTSRRFYSFACFQLTPEQAEQFRDGILALQIPMKPYAHQQKWRKDKIGRKLYAMYQQLQVQVRPHDLQPSKE